MRALFVVPSEPGGHYGFRRIGLASLVSNFSARITAQVVAYSVPSLSQISFRNNNLNVLVLGEKALGEAIAKFKPDVIYSDYGFHCVHSRIRMCLARKRKPLIVCLRGNLWQESEERLSLASSSIRLFTMQKCLHACSYASLRLARKVLPNSKWLEKVAKRHMPRARTEVIYPIMNSADFYEEEGMRFQKPAVAIIQGHQVWSKVRGLLNFRKVVELLPRVHFYIAEGERVNQPFLRLVKEQYSGMENVHYVSGIHNLSAVRKMLTASDCYVLASGLDSLPVTVLEASLMRRPVIASRVGGVPETVWENETGWTVSNDAIREWAEKISLVMNDGKLRRRLGENGRNLVSRRFEAKKISSQLERVLLYEACR